MHVVNDITCNVWCKKCFVFIEPALSCVKIDFGYRRHDSIVHFVIN